MYIVKLEEGVWLAEGTGDPSRTTVEANAQRFAKFTQAKSALKLARVFKFFENARIVEVKHSV
jgi:predicted GIY-YIG superfamily endonuclease